MTRPIKVISRWERFKRLTVWHPMNTDPSDDYRHGPRFWYPVFDLMMIALGTYAYFFGSPLLDRLFPIRFVELLGVAIITSAVLAAIGAVFPRLYLVELVGKLGLVFLLAGYAGTVATLHGATEPNGFLVITLFSLVWLLGSRLSWLFIRLSKEPRVQRLLQHIAIRRAFREAAREAKRRGM